MHKKYAISAINKQKACKGKVRYIKEEVLKLTNSLKKNTRKKPQTITKRLNLEAKNLTPF